jgi:hypothetical protein
VAGETVLGTPGVRSRRGRRGGSGNEAGAVLILALVYIVAISLIVGALADWAMNDLSNTTKFNSTGQLDTALSSVTDLAIQNIRYTPDPLTPVSDPTGLGNCWAPSGSPAVSQYLIDSYTIAVWCNTTTAFASVKTRTVTFYACVSTLNASSTASAITTAMNSCSASPMLTAIVVFDDYPSQGAPGQTVQCNIGLMQCGEGMKLTSWIWA